VPSYNVQLVTDITHGLVVNGEATDWATKEDKCGRKPGCVILRRPARIIYIP
jgi:hypothetical protein